MNVFLSSLVVVLSVMSLLALILFGFFLTALADFFLAGGRMATTTGSNGYDPEAKGSKKLTSLPSRI